MKTQITKHISMNHSTTRLKKLAITIATLAVLMFAPQLFAATDFTVRPGRAAYPVSMTVGSDQNLWFTENSGLKIGSITTGGVITEFPVAGAQGLTGIVSGPDGNIWFTDEFAGSISNGLATFALPPNSHPQGITAGPDGNLWFVDQVEGPISGFKVGKITTAGLVTEYSTHVDAGIFDPEDFFPAQITAGPDGNLWFTNPQVGGHGKSLVGKITTSGAVTIYSTADIPVGITSGPDGNLWVIESGHVASITTSGVEMECGITGAGTNGITVGPDGNIWFNEADRIGYVTTACEVHELPASEFATFVAPSGITAGPDGALWFLGDATSNIGRITTAGQLTTYFLNAGSTPVWDTLGPDNAVWFTQDLADQVGRIDAHGVIRTFPTAHGAHPWVIVTGPDGNLWFVEHGTDKIAKMTTSGVITEYAARIKPRGGVGLWGITAGPDGNLWFTEYGHTYNNIVRITPNGVMTAFPIPTQNAEALYTTKGPDGNVWFTELGAQKVAKIDPQSGLITEYPYPGSNKPPEAIVTGPDGNLWIMVGTAFGAIGKFSTAGTLLAEYPARFQTLDDIRVGSDSALWFNQYYPNGIGRITTSGVVSIVPLTLPNALGGDVAIGADGKIWVSEPNAGTIGRMSAIGGTGNTINATHGMPFQGAVASFVDGTPTATQDNFTAHIDWGDGNKTSGTVAGPTGGPFTVSGTHTYSTAATYNLTVTLHDNVDNATYTASPGIAHVY
jgi:streptogramin lyase